MVLLGAFINSLSNLKKYETIEITVEQPRLCLNCNLILKKFITRKMEMTKTKFDYLEYYKSLPTEVLIKRKSEKISNEEKLVIYEVLKFRGVDCPEKVKQIELMNSKVLKNNSLASIGARCAAKFLDSLIGVALLFTAIFSENLLPDVIRLVFVVIFVAYVFFKDSLFLGQSLGKRVLGISVINRTTGTYCSANESFIRNLLLFLLGIFDWFFIFLKHKQRLGDMAANTLVVKNK